MKISLPEKVKVILEQLEAGGYEGYAVGGCVRDSILGKEPQDWDITTSARPEEVKRLFPKTFDTGIEHGTVTVLLDKEGFEVTTYRIDGEYEDSRHPKTVEFTANLIQDLQRRDFTMNAMAYSERSGLVDAFGGLEDIQRQLIRCVGEPRERFTEDALRMLRAVRFSAQLGFRIEEQTEQAIQELAGTLAKISAERIQAELTKLVVSEHPDWIRKAYDTGITAVILPEFDRIMEQPQNSSHHIYSVGEHTMIAMRSIEADKVLRFTMLLHDMGKPDVSRMDEEGIYHFRGHAADSEKRARQILKRLKFDNDTSHRVCRLVLNHSLYPQQSPEGVRRAVHQVGEDLFSQFLKVKRADVLAQNPKVQPAKLRYLDQLQLLYEEILARGDCMSLKQLAVTGKDLIASGMRPGPILGELLNQLLEDVLEYPEHNQKEYLLEKSRQIVGD